MGVGFFQVGLGPGTPAAPARPVLSCAAGTSQVVATITGAAGATHYLLYKGSSHSDWQDGGSRNGDGNITVTGLSDDVPYIFTCYSQIDSGPLSLPAVGVLVTLSAATESSEAEIDDLLENTAHIFLDKFGEPVTYYPRGGGSREILGIVDRLGPGGLPGAPGGNSPQFTVEVANNSLTGISSGELDTGGDKVGVPNRIGQTAVQRPILKIITQDAGMMRLELQ